MNKSITFEASIPSIQRAIQIGGSGGVRVEFDIPESSMPSALHLVTMREQALMVTVEGQGSNIEAPKVPKRDGERQSCAQRMRTVIWYEHSAAGGTDDTFSEHYHNRMNKLIAMIESGEI